MYIVKPTYTDSKRQYISFYVESKFTDIKTIDIPLIGTDCVWYINRCDIEQKIQQTGVFFLILSATLDC